MNSLPPSNLFLETLNKRNKGRPPVWFMRQAGRYHSHYQELKKKYSFTEICKIPEVACEATMGPMREFDFDAAILFSDLLFPLEVMGMGLTYDPGPKLDWHLKSRADLDRLRGGADLVGELDYQAQAMRLIRKALPQDKGLLGFVGGPLTLFCYAVEGSHQGDLSESQAGLLDGRFKGFNAKLLELLAQNMALQARAGADTIAVLDTCAGEFSPEIYAEYAIPAMRELFRIFKQLCPNTPITYYSKKTGPAHWKHLDGLPIDAMGIDWNHDIAEVLKTWGSRYAIQGNVDPDWLFLPAAELETRLREVFGRVKALSPEYRRGWVCGLGHGVLQKTPEANVHLFLKIQKEVFGGSS
ncbi:MAG: uroporphyrinogen decarboxylase [Methylotenera sp.]|nr:uroporphyrinogen decarboxylase [Oligoflexia bacterium]